MRSFDAIARTATDAAPRTVTDAAVRTVSDAAARAVTDANDGTPTRAHDTGIDALQATTIPRPVAPLSTSRVTTQTPTLHWVLPDGVSSTTVELCSDRACLLPIMPPTLVAGTSYAVTELLEPGVAYWRLHPGSNMTEASATWEFMVGARSAPVDTSWGTTLDVNGDGFADLAIGAESMVYIYAGSATGIPRTPTFTLEFPSGDYGFGRSVANAGDVNGDGYGDLIVGGVAPDSVQLAFLYLGSAAGSHVHRR